MVIMATVSLGAVVAGTVMAMDNEANRPSFNINVIGARKQLSSDWKPTDQQDEIGGDFDMRGNNWPVLLNFAYLYATQKDHADELISVGNVTTAFTNLEREATTEELDLGIKKIWTDESRLSFSLAGGAAWIKGRLKFMDTAKFDDSKLGWYGSAAIYYTFFNFLNVGVNARYSDVKLTLGSRDDINAGGFHYGALVGFHF